MAPPAPHRRGRLPGGEDIRTITDTTAASRAAVGLLASGLALFALAVCPTPALATISGGCTGTGSAASGSVNLAADDTWHVRQSDQMSGSANAPSQQTRATVSLYAFGISYPIVNATGIGQGGGAGPFSVSDFSRYTRVIAAAGSSDSCSGSLLIIVDDVSVFQTLAGQVFAVLAGVFLLALLAMLWAGRSVGMRVLGALVGMVAGIGVGGLFQEMGIIDPRTLVGIIVVAAGLVLGAVLTGAFRRPPVVVATAAGPPPAAPPPAAPPPAGPAAR